MDLNSVPVHRAFQTNPDTMVPSEVQSQRPTDDDIPKMQTPRFSTSASRTSSQISQSTEQNMPANSSPNHEYSVHYGSWHANLIFSSPSPSKVPIYFVEMSVTTPNKPDAILRDVRGRTNKQDKAAPVLGVARFRWSRNINMGLGDPEQNANEMVWEDMTNETMVKHSKYRFEFETREMHCVSDTEGGTVPSFPSAAGRRVYCWERTRSSEDGVTGLSKLSCGSYRLVDEQSGEMIAAFSSNGVKSWKKAGKLRIRDTVPKELEPIIVLSIASIVEKLRRRDVGGFSGYGGGGASS